MSTLTLPFVIAHRAATQATPENTLAGMRNAAAYGASWIEFDVMLTQDDIAVVFHDDTLQRTSNGCGKIAGTTYYTLKKLDAGGWFHPDFTNEPIPTLDTFLAQAAQLKLGINIELKAVETKAAALAKQVVDQLKKHWHSELPQPLVSSFCYDNLLAIKNLCHTYSLGLNVKKIQREHLEQAKILNAYSIHVSASHVDKKTVEVNSKHGFKTLVYTVNNKKAAMKLAKLGVKGIFSDNESLFQLSL